MNEGIILALELAIKQDELEIVCDSFNDAYNFRQRFYRYRDMIRKDESHKFFLLADNFQFFLKNNVLVIKCPPIDPILEKLHDQHKLEPASGSNS